MSRFKSIQSALLGWFLVIALLPMGMIGWYGYRAAITSITEIQNTELEATANRNVEFVKNWFGEIEKDLRAWAGLPAPKASFIAILKGWKESGLPLAEYVKTASYQHNIMYGKLALGNLQRSYDYAHDIFMIDLDGNIIFSVRHEKDFMSNLRIGKYASTLFARAYRETLADGKSHFSDLEYYEASQRMLSGFLTTPLRNNAGDMIGVMALQLRIDSMFERLGDMSVDHSVIHHYMVGPDGLLRTQRGSHGILKERVSTELFWNWSNRLRAIGGFQDDDKNEKTIQYRGPDGHPVIGKYYDVDILGTHWIHISEMSLDKALKPSRDLAKVIIIMLLMGVGGIIFTARFLSKRLTDPIVKLREASRAYGSGDENFTFTIASDNEIGELAHAFSDMVSKQQKSARELALLAESEKLKSTALSQALEESLRLSQVVGQSPYPIAITDTEGKIEYINQELLRLSGYTAEELMGKNMSVLRSDKHGEFIFQALWERISVEKKVWHGTLINRMKNGNLRDWDSTIFPLFDTKGVVSNYVSIVNDVTEINAKERVLLLQSRQAQMGEMLSMIAHQWRQPLAIINALVGKMLLQEMFKEEPDEGLNASLKQIEDQSLFLSRTITDFRDFFRSDKPREDIACSQLIHNAMSLIDHAVKTHSLNVITTLNSDPIINTYANEVLQVLITLIKNSLDAFEESSVAMKTLELSVDQTVDQAIISVSDNAGGIDPTIMKEIFSPYFTTKQGDKGTGLGLYMAKIVVEEHCHGSLSVESSDGMSTFRVSLPLKSE